MGKRDFETNLFYQQTPAGGNRALAPVRVIQLDELSQQEREHKLMTALATLIEHATTDPNCEAIGTEGSQNNPALAPDAWTDLDVTLVMAEPTQANAEAWLAPFGEIVIAQHFANTHLFGPSSAPWDTWLVRFKDHPRLDLKIAPAADIPAYLAADTLNAIVWTKAHGRITPRQTSAASHVRPRLTQEALTKCLNELYWSLGNVIKALARHQLVGANEILNQICRPQLLDLLADGVASRTGRPFNPGAFGQLIPAQLPAEEQAVLTASYRQDSLLVTAKAVEAVMMLAQTSLDAILTARADLQEPAFVGPARTQLATWLSALHFA